MSGSVNRATLIGNLVEDPRVRTTEAGKKIVALRVATNESYKDKSGERVQKTEYHNVVIFNDGLARVAESYLKKGDKAYIEGQLQTRKWTDKDGHERYTTEIVLGGFNSSLVLLGGKPKGETQAPSHDDVWGLG
jgi:single-strand DNA-binding protein